MEKAGEIPPSPIRFYSPLCGFTFRRSAPSKVAPWSPASSKVRPPKVCPRKAHISEVHLRKVNLSKVRPPKVCPRKAHISEGHIPKVRTLYGLKDNGSVNVLGIHVLASFWAGDSGPFSIL